MPSPVSPNSRGVPNSRLNWRLFLNYEFPTFKVPRKAGSGLSTSYTLTANLQYSAFIRDIYHSVHQYLRRLLGRGRELDSPPRAPLCRNATFPKASCVSPARLFSPDCSKGGVPPGGDDPAPRFVSSLCISVLFSFSTSGSSSRRITGVRPHDQSCPNLSDFCPLSRALVFFVFFAHSESGNPA